MKMLLVLTDEWSVVLVCSQHHEAQSICNILAPQEPQEAFQCPLTHQEEDHVFPPVQGAPPEIQREVHAHPQRWRSSGTLMWIAVSVDIFGIKVHFIYLTCLCCVQTGCPWTLQRPADRQSSAGLQEKVCHLHRACAEREGQRNHSPCRHPPQQGQPHLHLGSKSCANVHTQDHTTEANRCKSVPRSLMWTCWKSHLCYVLKWN